MTSAVYSPRLEKNIALGMIRIRHSTPGTELMTLGEGGERVVTIVEKPFYDPMKKIVSA